MTSTTNPQLSQLTPAIPGLSTYIPLEKLTSNSFTSSSYANDLVRSVNTTTTTTSYQQSSNPSDTLVDLTTPLQKTLFDLQELDTTIHTLTSHNALEILRYTQQQNATAQRILRRVDEERGKLVEDFERVRGEVLGRYERAMEARRGAERSLGLLRVLRGVQRVLGLARAFEACLGESGLGSVAVGKEEYRSLVRAARVVLEFRDLMGGNERGVEDLERVSVVRQVRGRVFEDGEARVVDWARRIVREFSVSSLVSTNGQASSMVSAMGGFGQADSTRARLESAVHVLYLLSPTPRLEGGRRTRREEFEPEYLLRALQGYLQTAVTSSAAGIGRGLGQLPLLERALLEVSARCQNVIALGLLLGGIELPVHPLLEKGSSTRRKSKTTKIEDMDDDPDLDEELDGLGLSDGVVDELVVAKEPNCLEALLSSLDTSSLTSYFWRSLASSLTTKVQEILNRGGVSARTLKSNKDAVRTEIRDCVMRGSKMPSMLTGRGPGGKEEVVPNWEREAAVMVGSVIGPLGR